MRLPLAITDRIYEWARRRIVSRRPHDFLIGSPDNPYLYRWWVIPRNRWFNIYLHHIVRSDDDRALHDHPWFNGSILLSGSYFEHTIARGGIHTRVLLRAGDLKLRGPSAAHRLELANLGGCWTLFITGPRVREWGFHCPEAGWRHWRDFTAPAAKGQIGRGCGEVEP